MIRFVGPQSTCRVGLARDRDERDVGGQSCPRRFGGKSDCAERARTAGIAVSFWTYCRAGIALAAITLIGARWLS
jgi:hypothetical protein